MSKVRFFIVAIFLFSVKVYPQEINDKIFEVTFFVAADTHFDPPPESDQYYHILAMNTICGTVNGKDAVVWPEFIDGVKTEFGSAGQKINIPNGVVLVGDITDRADPAALKLFKSRYEKGEGDKKINFHVYIGLGNHDLDPQHVGVNAEKYKNNMLAYVKERHQGKNAPVPVLNFDDLSKNYSWNWGNVHFIQTHRFAGNTENGQTNSLDWLAADLKKYAKDGKPVIIFQHYGFDKWSLGWWSEKEREQLYNTIKKYNIVGIFVGHNHFAENIIWKGINVFQVNNAWPDDDGNGSFAVCKITNNYMDVVTCRWKDGQGNVELIAPYFHKEFK